MKIKQIELNGFKSFAERKTFQLHSGITCIVGPNGCGKSNVVDAFRWVLGEQSVKSLRGEKMEEVIFQGSANVKQKGMAEVTLQISRGGGGAPENGNGGASPESTTPEDLITVARRLYRSGESEYYLNKKQCRLKDIRDIFLDTGLDVKSYSILDQGRVSEIINTKPLDRRFLIEEIAGVMKYKVRKTEALSKLESSKQNLQRINDIVHEVKRQINSLDRQVRKAERYKRLIDELKTLELRVAKREHLRLNGILGTLLSEIERVRELDSSKRSELSTLESKLEAKRIELVEKEKLLSELENSLYAKEREISESEKHIAVLKNGMENRRADILRLTTQQNEYEIKKEEFSKRIEELNNEVNALSSAMAGLSDELKEKKDSLADMEISIGDRESALEDKRRELFGISESLSARKNELHKLQSSIETLKYRESLSIKDMESTREGIATLQKTIGEAEENIRTATGRHTGMLSERDGLIAEIERLDNVIEEQKALLARERELLASNIARLNSLKELTVDRSLTDFMSEAASCAQPGAAPEERQTDNNGLPARCQVLSDVISAGKEHEKAVEAALAEKINSVILDGIEDILAAVTIIKEKQLGRTAIFYKGLSERPAPGDSGSALVHDAIIGRASDFITLEDAELQGSAGRLLQSTYIVKDLQSAIALRNEGVTGNAPLATLDGEVIDADGIVFAGQGKDILKRKREIKELQNSIQGQQSMINAAEGELNETITLLSGRKEALKGIESAIVDVEKEISLIRHSLASQKDDLERMGRKLSFLDTEVTSIAEEQESVQDLMNAKTVEIEQAEKERDIINEEIATFQNSLASVKAEYEEARSHLTDLRLAITSHKEKAEALQREAANFANAIEGLERSKESAANDIQEAEKKLADSQEELLVREEAIKGLVIEADAMREERTTKKEAIDEEGEALVGEANALKGIRAEIDAVSQELSGLGSKEVEHRLRKENIETSIMQKYGVEIQNIEVETETPAPEDAEQAPAAEDVQAEEPLNGAQVASEEITEAAEVTETTEGAEATAAIAENGIENSVEKSAPQKPQSDEERINWLNDKIRALGPVNLGTIEEYEELKGRYDFLTKQQKDLTLSIAELEEAISRINTSTKRKLREAYDALRAKFTEVFTTLFGGGRADLLLTDEENILESGLDIIAQPPGKKLQNIHLLSGGEKALTSLTLLFAGFLIKPSPLCILDEVDAPLDESNTGRFAQMIKGLSKDTQFIVITHNKTTMEAADYIYGITMQEPGVSKAISLQFAEVQI